MKVFSNRHFFAIWCAVQIHKYDVIKKMFLRDFKQHKKDCQKRGIKFNYDDFVIRFYNFYVLMGSNSD